MVYVSALRLDDGELLIVITPESCSTAISDYGKRWGIEKLGLKNDSFIIKADIKESLVRQKLIF